ncbi:ABC transporter permease [Rhodoferax sp. AJA081-3]|uniref:ABC transporter permease n=1 Tax=Rhodoferax sp. AJA081-3 TaxID=2752316 RepID=UPI001ADEC9A1|nr:ABC transporter permease [Rhodoferax sp. AJA081-3]QTN26927.1 ABC transporter permease [Rhodoferax sp. AJA081-3]
MLYGYLPAILEGLGLTLRVSALSLAIACVFGLIGAAAKLSGSRAARWSAEVYTTLIRGMPELVLMLLIFYGGQIGINKLAESQGWDYIDIPPFIAGVLTIGFIFGAYLTETFRGAILAVPKGQAEAGLAFAMSRNMVWRRIVLPQMVRHAIPGFANNWLIMIKASALVSIIGLDDMVHRAGLAAASTRAPFTFYVAVALIYLTLTSVSIFALSRVEARFSLGVKKVQF